MTANYLSMVDLVDTKSQHFYTKCAACQAPSSQAGGGPFEEKKSQDRDDAANSYRVTGKTNLPKNERAKTIDAFLERQKESEKRR